VASGGRVRTWLTALVLLLGVYGTWASAQKEAERPPYPNGRFLATAEWLQQHLRDDGLVVVDVRNDKYFDGQLALFQPVGRIINFRVAEKSS